MLSWTRTPFLAIWAALSANAIFAKSASPLDRQTPPPADQPIPIIDFFRPPLLEAPKLNPAGTHFAAFVTTDKDRQELLFSDLKTHTGRRLAGSGDKDIYRFDWLTDNRLIFSLSREKLYAEGIYVVDLDKPRDSYPVELYNATALVGIPDRNPLQPIVWIRHNAFDEGADGGVVELDTRKRIDREFSSGPGGAARDRHMEFGTKAAVAAAYPPLPSGIPVFFLPDPTGELEFGTSVDQGVYTLFRLAHGKWDKCPVDLDAVNVIAAGDKAGELLVVGLRRQGKPRAAQRLNAVSGQLGEVVCEDSRYDCVPDRIYRHPVSHQIVGLRYHANSLKSVWFDGRYEAVQATVEKLMPGQIVVLLGSDRREKRFFLSAFSDRKPVAYYLLDIESRELSPVKDPSPWIDPARTQPMQTIDYKARDGVPIEGYVTFPAGTSKAKPVPLVVLPHGGPWARDVWGWDPEVQFLASRGYAVLQPNYRGSTGSEWMFPIGDRWEFRKMHDDVTDGVKALLKTGLVDPARVAIMGTSFGGYLALCGAAFEPDLYRCAISVAGVFDWELMIREAHREDDDSRRSGVYQRNLGEPKQEKERFDAISPLRHVDQIKIPIFVSHGKEDSVVYVGQTKRLIDELKLHRVPYEALLVSGEGHGMTRIENQVALYGAIEAFLSRNLAGARPPAAAP